MRVPLATQSYRARALPLSAQRLVNLYPEIQPPDAKSKLVLYGTPGLRLFGEAGNGPIRGAHVMNDQLYVVSGSGVYLVDGSGIGTLLGTVGGLGHCPMSDNGTQLAICTPDDSGKAYIATATTLNQITDPDFPQVSSVDYLDGYFIFTILDSDEFIISAIRDGTAYDALDFATAEASPDKLLACLADHRELWMFGTNSIEVWQNTGANNFPFERISGAVLEKGCGARDSVAKLNNAVFWLGNDLIVYRALGFVPERISTHAIEYALSKYGRTDDAFAHTYTQEGHFFYCLTFPSAGASWVYDPENQFWHERESRGLGRWRVNDIVSCYGQVIGGDLSSGKLYAIEMDTYSEDGTAIVRSAVSPPLHADGKRAIMRSFEIEVECGVGLTTGQGSDPQAMLDWSDDGGKTWSNQLSRSIGAIGAFTRRVKWNRLGQFRTARVVRVAISDPIKVAIIAANTEIEAGTS